MKRIYTKSKILIEQKKFLISLFCLFCLQIFSDKIIAQNNCGQNTPSFVVNLTGNPNGSWISPYVVRNDTCCGAQAPDACVQFEITLDSASQGISFNIYSGAIPSGAMYYQVNCGPPVAVGTPLCLTGVGPFYLTFCKPGNNSNQYIITSIAKPSVSANIVLNQGCSGKIYATGYNISTITWTSVYPGPQGSYDSYLSCKSACDTTIVTAQPGYPPYVDYMVCGIPAGGCSTLPVCDTVRVFFNPTLFANIIPANPTICFGYTSKTITASASGGTVPYTYLWSTGATSQTITVGVGSYTVTVHDATNCPPTTATVTVTSFANPITANAGNDITVCGQNPTVVLNGNVTGASGGIWTNGSGTFNPNNTTLNASYTPSSSEINNGIAMLILITTGNGTCPPDSDTLVIHIAVSPNISVSPTNVLCYGMNTGSATANVSGGNPPYTYQWLPCGCTVNPLGNLYSGTYTAIVTDANGCSSSAPTIITQPSVLSATASVNGNVSCYGGSNGSASVSASGGISPYTYSWSSGQTTSSVSGLTAGNYSVVITDNNGCTKTDVINIVQPSTLAVSVSQQDVQCYGMSNGSASVSANGGTSPYSYQWNTGQTTSSITGLSSGNYFVTVTDSKGCINVQNIFISQPSQVMLSIFSMVNVSCFGGSNGTATAVTYGGIPPYTYMWNTMPSQTSANATGLSAGNYIVTVLDSNGCSMMIAVNITEPPALSLIMNWVNAKCYGTNSGSASVSVSGGTPPYSYSWSNNQTSSSATNLSAGNYSVTITDANGCTHTNTVSISQPAVLNAVVANVQNVSCYGMQNGSASVNASGGTSPYYYQWSNGQTTSSATNFSAGNYSVMISDANGCTAPATVTISQPNAIAVSVSPDDTVCPGQNTTISANASGGTSPFTYFWQPSVGFGNSQIVHPTSSTTYTAIVTDAHGCTNTGIVNILVYDLTIALAVNATPHICEGQVATVSASVTGNYITNYYWSNNLGNGAGPYVVSPSGTTTYSVTVTNMCGATATASATVIVYPLPQIHLAPQSASGCDNVALQFSDTSSANAGSTYFWNFGDGFTSSQANPSHTYSSSGNYAVTVTVTTHNGCSSSAQTYCTVTVIPSPDAEFTSDPPLETSIINPGFHFYDASKNATQWKWSFGDGANSSLENPVHTYAQTGIYVVKLITLNNGGCIDSIIKTVEVKPEFAFYIPNTFSPNGDHLNDVFSGKGMEITQYDMQIFDHWGEIIFETTELEKGWDGTAKGGSEISPEGVYVYKVQLRDFENKEHNYVGNVNLIK
ncbi:MAG: gliding motility-associated C-terminal domain-containing protein [Bacteroidetes bacterium]|nr:gliding motility-associated C-terminal domain-containing protein [Bacteroidota bacterium]